jgi:hypothetical protein
MHRTAALIPNYACFSCDTFKSDSQSHAASQRLVKGELTMQANIRITCIYLALCHVLLSTTSPIYKHHVKRFVGVGSSRLAQLSEYAFVAFYSRLGSFLRQSTRYYAIQGSLPPLVRACWLAGCACCSNLTPTRLVHCGCVRLPCLLPPIGFGYVGAESGPAWRKQLSSGQWR